GAGFVLWVAVITGFSIGHWLLFTLFLAHSILGSLELGTDSWIENINVTIFTPCLVKMLFIFVFPMMFGLRFSSHWIENKLKLSPVAILFVCSLFAIAGLYLAAGATGVTTAIVAMFVYSIGKTFFWPTMLAVVGDRFPRTGAVAMSIMGGIGMMSAGLLGGPGLGYAKDRYTVDHLKETNAALYEANKAEKPSSFLFFDPVTGLDGTKLSEAQTAESKTPEQQALVDASIIGDRKTLKADAFIPVTMAAIYLLLLLY